MDSKLALVWGGSRTVETEFLAAAACLEHLYLPQYFLHSEVPELNPARWLV